MLTRFFIILSYWFVDPEEGGKNAPKHRFKRKGGKKERIETPINCILLFGYGIIFSVFTNPGRPSIISIKNFTSPSLSRKFRANKLLINIGCIYKFMYE